MAAAPLEQTFWETFCDLIGLEPELHDDEKSSTATKARVAALIATEKFHGVPRWFRWAGYHAVARTTRAEPSRARVEIMSLSNELLALSSVEMRRRIETKEVSPVE